jgi:hypothetical protein
MPMVLSGSQKHIQEPFASGGFDFVVPIDHEWLSIPCTRGRLM